MVSTTETGAAPADGARAPEHHDSDTIQPSPQVVGSNTSEKSEVLPALQHKASSSISGGDRDLDGKNVSLPAAQYDVDPEKQSTHVGSVHDGRYRNAKPYTYGYYRRWRHWRKLIHLIVFIVFTA
ncbi:hypothetical protein B0T26DRAFT_336473 [Lasiosphaeria miniovina]|uniref:Uncharacterized protein n=1 Tax=Lasiosphaeria miniovina TaxID=1954250 RepID=A0AA40AAN4_9PEZI|nr:uncharacterized protein B0T26DRAFT_336473 [Lasiosphaeria miniovina]KAK0712388.1 hypothetical protein B0T26DRAFT_336473 [Lasiosphaeria miniovina]